MNRASSPARRRWGKVAMVVVTLAIVAVALSSQARQPQPPASAESFEVRGLDAAEGLVRELGAAAIRLPLAAALGAALAWRPRRAGAPKRRPAVVETQIVLAVVGALIMLVVGSSLARAFGIVGVASLIRYRSKINDPKDAVVMLCALAVGLASGSGLFALASFSTLFLFALLWFVEGFAPPIRVFDLSVKLGERSAELRPAVERVLRRHDVGYELRGTSEQESAYLVTVPNEVSTDLVSKDLIALAVDGKGAVEWSESKTQPQ